MGTENQFEKLFNASLGFAKDTLVTRGELMPMWHAVTTDDKHFVIATPWESPKEKTGVLNYIRLLFLVESVKEFVFMTEAWFKSAKSLADRPKGFIADEPDKREALLMHGQSIQDGKLVQKGKMFEILRRGSKAIELKEMEVAEMMEGKLTDILSLKKPDAREIVELRKILDEIMKLGLFKHTKVDLK